jgi:hypothetical protein
MERLMLPQAAGPFYQQLFHPEPLGEGAKNIRTALLREAFDRRERPLAGELTLHLKIVDRIDHTRYGLDLAQLKLPWPR